MKRLILTHNDLDGAGAAVLIYHFKVQHNFLRFCDYKDREQPFFSELLNMYDHIIFVDFSPLKEQLIEALEKGKIIEIYDHHKSSKELEEVVHENYKIIHDENRAGTKIFFDEYIRKNISNRVKLIIHHFVNLVNCYDLFKFDDPLWVEAQDLNRVLYGLFVWSCQQYDRYKEFIELCCLKFVHRREWFWDKEEKTIIDKDRKKEESLFRKSKEILQKRTDSKGNLFGLFHARNKISIICYRILKEMKDLKYIICINTFDGDDGTGWRKLSLRSRSMEEFDCTSLEGFEGHSSASGRECDIEFSKNLWTDSIKIINYKEG